MKIAKIGFIGKAQITPSETAKLSLMGKCIARSGRTLQIVPAQGSAEAVESGVRAEGGVANHLERGVIESSDHTFVYADDRLFRRLQGANPNVTNDKKVTLIFTELELDLWLRQVAKVFEKAGLQPPV